MRLGGFFIGILLFYAPFDLVLRGLKAVLPSATVLAADAGLPPSTTIAGLPPLWFAHPWQWLANGVISAWWIPLAVLPVLALLAGPVFCGWLCPAGALPELLGRLVPDRFKFDLRRYIDIMPVRLGFLLGFFIMPFASGAAQSNFSSMQRIVSALFANPAGLSGLSDAALLTPEFWVVPLSVLVWIVPLGMLTKGGRGWCLFLCPAGTIMGAISALTARLPIVGRIRVDASCDGCGACADVCPTRALGAKSSTPAGTAPIIVVQHNLCNECLDCTVACPARALRYGKA
jgi:ferredoxin-type protein NapH